MEIIKCNKNIEFTKLNEVKRTLRNIKRKRKVRTKKKVDETFIIESIHLIIETIQ